MGRLARGDLERGGDGASQQVKRQSYGQLVNDAEGSTLAPTWRHAPIPQNERLYILYLVIRVGALGNGLVFGVPQSLNTKVQNVR